MDTRPDINFSDMSPFFDECHLVCFSTEHHFSQQQVLFFQERSLFEHMEEKDSDTRSWITYYMTNVSGNVDQRQYSTSHVLNGHIR
jgi:hypothetical protein